MPYMVKAIVLAAGRGSRLKSKIPKVLHRVFDKPILAWVLDSLADVDLEEIIVICGYKAEEVQGFLHAYPVTQVIQTEQLGTGHALMCAREKLEGYKGTVLVVNGDSPLIQPKTLNNMIKFHQENILDMSILSCNLQNPDGYGRIIRKNHNIMAIKEDKDCSEAEKSILEVNAGVYCMEWNTISKGLNHLGNNNAQEEYYLTDLVGWAYTQGHSSSTFELENPYEVLGVNTREDLALVFKLKNEAYLQELMENGVTIIDPASTMISPEVEIGRDTVIYPGTFIQRRVTIGNNCEIGPNTYIYGPAEIGSGSSVIQSHFSRSSVGKNCQVGPYAHIREGCDIGDNVRLGSFVEVKNSAIGDNTSASHLTYLGDAKIKTHCNFGAGTVIANYDHRSGLKHECTIGANVSTGANSVLVSPIEIGKDSMIAAGSVVTKKVPENTLAIARPRQEHKPNRAFVRKN
jgi:bifunctional UDP-N-acetylglucosamine pyrophosphorylase/glucosamine-1-phosphate N-acetyltransferase